ncbi:predicted protein [Chaetomium globosum CBS 148.51]|uniref:Uncharacterized protein n=1 Tax=Chaetomium globosum (strain ATCC 6205 / CBS 148.51 / DSM 1962 / NBRC 6347 / NRRL 1970) TaxID=306901 RepID=Q2H412_CHAGB|nr:uncharacterized protein CHGG_06603 [Chaetomium globosum CBS 148.51]EAQ89984.1 predicted protein [Chaetomium globosum CBS 148.51]
MATPSNPQFPLGVCTCIEGGALQVIRAEKWWEVCLPRQEKSGKSQGRLEPSTALPGRDLDGEKPDAYLDDTPTRVEEMSEPLPIRHCRSKIPFSSSF